MTEEEIAFAWPDRVGRIDEVPKPFRDGYAPVDDGFALKPTWREAVQEVEGEIRAKLAQLDTKQADLETQLTALREENRIGLAAAEIGRALRDRGVRPGLCGGAEAALLHHLTIEAREDRGKRIAVVIDDSGELPVADAVGRWLDAHPEFLPPPPAQPGPAQVAMARLRRTII